MLRAIRNSIVSLASPLSLVKEASGLLNFGRFRQRGFFQNVLVLMTSTGLAQLLTVCFIPVLSRLYDPVDFGICGTFLSIAEVLGVVVTLQYCEALMLPAKDEVAAGVFWAAGCSVVAITILFSVPWFLFPSLWHGLFKDPQLSQWLWLVPVAAFMTGINRMLTAWCARRKAFRRAATVQVARSVTANCGQTVAGAMGFGAGGLIGGGVLGDFIANLGLFFSVIRGDRALLRAGASKQQVLAAAREHKNFALYSTPQDLLSAVSEGAPVILLIYYFGTAVGGMYAFAARALQFPMRFILSPLRQVLFQKLSEVHNCGGDLNALFVKTSGTLLGIALVPAAVGFFFAPSVFGFVFGAKWVVAGEYASWLLIWLAPAFCNLPAALLGRILGQQRNLLLFDLGLLISRLAVLMLGGQFTTPFQTIVAFSIVGAAFNISLILFIWRVLELRNVRSGSFR